MKRILIIALLILAGCESTPTVNPAPAIRTQATQIERSAEVIKTEAESISKETQEPQTQARANRIAAESESILDATQTLNESADAADAITIERDQAQEESRKKERQLLFWTRLGAGILFAASIGIAAVLFAQGAVRSAITIAIGGVASSVAVAIWIDYSAIAATVGALSLAAATAYAIWRGYVQHKSSTEVIQTVETLKESFSPEEKRRLKAAAEQNQSPSTKKEVIHHKSKKMS